MLKAYLAATTRLSDIRDHLQRLRREDSGAALIEYALIVGLMAVVVVAVMATMKTSLTTAFGKISAHLNSIT
jgi:Flp pilus assembly pilin Flp